MPDHLEQLRELKRPNGNGLVGLVNTHKGLIAVVSLVAAGAVGALWVSGLISLPARFDERVRSADAVIAAQEARIAALEARAAKDSESLYYMICTQIPPATRNELRALRIDCGPIEREIQQEIDQGGEGP